jgi:peptidoglycan/xylan/chitin deacetylase (PgdA/CDA1 family)
VSLLPRATLPVLMYHRFGSAIDGDPELWIDPDRFAAQLQWLRERRFRTLSLAEAWRHLRAGRAPKRAVLLTIDDGFASDLETAAPILERAGARAAVFVASDLLGQTVELTHPTAARTRTSAGTIADAAGLRRWLALGFDVGCHSASHADLTALASADLEREVMWSRQRLSAALDHPVEDFCYPFAHHDPAARTAVAAAGYRVAYAGEPPRFDDLYAVPRMMVYPGDSQARWPATSPGFDRSRAGVPPAPWSMSSCWTVDSRP